MILGGTRTKYLEIIGIISRKWLLGLELNRDFGFAGLVENQFLGINMTGNLMNIQFLEEIATRNSE